ncbi:hypothetical protein C5D16_00855 [Rathayibacter toxicus]|nr:hypothetical protein C5D15_00840 [Rathayibacter toxicus]PPG48295.1 hypothetical protein C5D16_00855 [Rathayibacter toxicus]PPH74443.1 hypothetical protein C5D24_00845 [Rathayibacter toxicus]PPI25855.1 hypothetical protein C5D55_00845 [Rathayibacter toxicus]PPI45701.1 hypothetical protein C5D43_03570 [Rathayibacter toxicus]
MGATWEVVPWQHPQLAHLALRHSHGGDVGPCALTNTVEENGESLRRSCNVVCSGDRDTVKQHQPFRYITYIDELDGYIRELGHKMPARNRQTTYPVGDSVGRVQGTAHDDGPNDHRGREQVTRGTFGQRLEFAVSLGDFGSTCGRGTSITGEFSSSRPQDISEYTLTVETRM